MIPARFRPRHPRSPRTNPPGSPAPMKSWLKLCGDGVWFCGRSVLRLVLWSLWLGLSLLLGLEIWIATSHELAVPAFVLRSFEERLALSQVQVKFGRAHFDPSGRILVHDLRISLPAFAEPVVTNRAAYLELDPWALLAGRFEPRRLQLSGASLAVPAMLSTSGRAEEIVRDLEAIVRPGENELIIDQLTARIAGIAVTLHGRLHFVTSPGNQAAPLPVADLLSRNFPDLCRQLVRVTQRLAALDDPALNVELTPSVTRGAIATVTVTARSYKLGPPFALSATGLSLTTRFPLQGEAPVMSPLTLTVDDLQLPGGVDLQGVRARVRGSLKPALYTYDPRDVLLSASRLTAAGFTFTNPVARLTPGPLPRLEGQLIAGCAGLPLDLRGSVDLATATAAVHLDGALSPALLPPIGAALGHDLRPYLGLGAPLQFNVDLAFAAGWKFTRLTGRVATAAVDAYHVKIDAVRGEIEWDGRTFTARHAYARFGDNFAYGSFAQDFETMEHRFLLEGRLRPMLISPWFGKWWPAFFKDYEFPLTPPDASVDVQSHLRESRVNTVFVYADSASPVIHGVKFDHARALLFIRPNFLDGLEVFTTIGSGSARGTFARQVDTNFDLISLDLNFDSTLALDVPGRIFGPVVADVLAPYAFETPPAVKLLMHFDGMASPDGVHQLAQIAGTSVGPFTFHDFPLSNLSFHANVRDDEVVLDRIEVGFAGGRTNGSARVWGADPHRRLGFDYTVRNANFRSAVGIVEAFSAQRAGLPPPPPEKYIQDKANVKLDLAVSAEGLYDDPYSYRGTGNATLNGETLGEVRMLGLLSELLSFTSLRFTSARASFKVEGNRLEFPQINVTGSNSAIDAHGNYTLDRHELDFIARVNPFQESSFLPTALLGAVFTPFAPLLEVKLTGLIDKPKWAFVNGPTNFFRNLSKPASPPAAPAAAPAKP